MSYRVGWGYCAEIRAEVETLDAAIIVALTALHNDGRPWPRGWYPPIILNMDRYDVDDGRISSGLTADERDRVMAAGL